MTPQSPPQDSVSIAFRDVSYHSGSGQAILSVLSLEVRCGETLVLLGRSGSGKTTALKLINRLLEPCSGQVLVESRSTTDWDAVSLRRRIGYVIQEVGIFPHMSVEANIGLLLQLEGKSRSQIRSRVEELMTLVGLDPQQFRSRYPRELSGGQRQRVGVARALAADPPLLLMDEPFGALDPLTRSELQREFQALQRRLAKTIVFVTHDLREALFLGSRIALLTSGQLHGVYTPQEFETSADPLVQAYVSAFSTQNHGSS